MLLDGKVCLITGSGGGLGRAASILFAREGGKILVTDLDEEGGRETVRLVEEVGGEAAFLPGDVSDDEQVRALFDQAVERFGRLDVSYHNAGIMHPDDTSPVDTPLEVWQKRSTSTSKASSSAAGTRSRSWSSLGAGRSSTSPPSWR